MNTEQNQSDTAKQSQASVASMTMGPEKKSESNIKKFLPLSAALLVTACLVLWLIGGNFQSQPDRPTDIAPESKVEFTSVALAYPEQKPLHEPLLLYGLTAANRRVSLKAQIDGNVILRSVSQGTSVEAGQILLELDPKDSAEQLYATAARIEELKSQYEAVKQLKIKDLVGHTQVMSAKAALASAQAQLKQIHIEQAQRILKAPFSGVINMHYVELGDYVQRGTVLFELLELAPTKVKAEVSEQQLSQIFLGQKANVTLSSGQSFSGSVSYISKVPTEITRTFPIEVILESAAHSGIADPLPAVGLTATLLIDTPVQQAFLVSPALVSLDDRGNLGIKTLSSDGLVGFSPVKILRADNDGLWVSGLQEATPVITLGQGFVTVGEQVQGHWTQNRTGSDIDQNTR